MFYQALGKRSSFPSTTKFGDFSRGFGLIAGVLSDPESLALLLFWPRSQLFNLSARNLAGLASALPNPCFL